MNGPLDGIKVIECGHWLVVPIAGKNAVAEARFDKKNKKAEVIKT